MLSKNIKGTTKIYAVIGDPIVHSFSPAIHNSIFEKAGLDAVYIPLKIEERNLKEFTELLRGSFSGCNVTIPYKQKIIPYLDELDESAKLYGAVNTVKVKDKKLIGYNTDGYGFIKSLKLEGILLENKPILLIGAGGAARMAAFELLKEGAILTIANRNKARAKRLKEELIEYGWGERVNISGLDEIKEGYLCIVNATPIGMFPQEEEIPVNIQAIKGSNVVYDMIYNPYRTKLLNIAKEHGCKIINGFSMLFYQAIKAQEIWLGRIFDDEILQPVYRAIESSLQEVVE